MSSFASIEQMVRQESSRLNHYYLGVEHLFIVLAQMPLATSALEAQRISPLLVCYAIRETAGTYKDRRYWEDYKPTPRYEYIIQLAHHYASSPGERELLLAIIDEGNNVPVRILQELGINLQQLRDFLMENPVPEAQLPQIESSEPISRLDTQLLQRFFEGHERVRIDKEVEGNFSTARYYAISEPIPAIIKFDRAYTLIQEYRRAEAFSHIPHLCLPSIPILNDQADLGLLKYELPALTLKELNSFLKECSVAELPLPQTVWHQQGDKFQFALWREYEFTLPPALVVAANEKVQHKSAYPVQPLQDWSRTAQIPVGKLVNLQDFTVREINLVRGTLLLGAGAGYEGVNAASQIEVTGLSKGVLLACYPGQSIRSLFGIVTRTREDILLDSLRDLAVTYNLLNPTLVTPMGNFTNPLSMIGDLLMTEIQGYLSFVHGSFSPSCMLRSDEEGIIRLYDFSSTRYGHVLYDWAFYELSVLVQFMEDLAAENILSLWQTLLSPSPDFTTLEPDIAKGGLLILASRAMAAGFVIADVKEYFYALIFTSFQFLGFSGISLASRRLIFAWLLLATQKTGE